MAHFPNWAVHQKLMDALSTRESLKLDRWFGSDSGDTGEIILRFHRGNHSRNSILHFDLQGPFKEDKKGIARWLGNIQ